MTVTHKTCLRLVGQVMTSVLNFIRGSAAKDAHHVQAWILAVKLWPIHSQFGEGTGAKRGQQHVGLCQLLMKQSLPSLGFEVGLHDGDAIVQLCVGCWAVDVHGVCTGVSLRCHGLQLGALRSHAMTAQECSRAWQIQGEAEHANALQGKDGGAGDLHACFVESAPVCVCRLGVTALRISLMVMKS